MEKIEVTITKETGRIDKIISSQLSGRSRSQVQQWLKNGYMKVNGAVIRSNYQVKQGDSIVIELPDPLPLSVQEENIPLEIVYEDADVVVVNKPQGMVVHPAAGHAQGTMVNALLYHVKDLSTINDVVRPGIVHRIDKDTSGLLVVAKNNEAHVSLAEQLKNKTTIRKYIALVHGEISHEKGSINAPIGRSKKDRKMQEVVDGGKEAVTHFEVLERFSGYTLVSLQLETGRTHQIRAHMKYIGYPIAGDPLYGPKKTLDGNGQFLHAATLGFEHPKTGELLTFQSPLPTIFEEIIKQLKNKD